MMSTAGISSGMGSADGSSREGARPIHVDNVLSAALYPELKRIAQARMRRERVDHTLQATALVNELYLRLLHNPDFTWQDRATFLMSASRAMRNLLVDHAREKQSYKRGGDWTRIEVTDAVGLAVPDSTQFLELNEALDKLARSEPRMFQVVELRFFGGLTFSEIGGVLGIHERTAKRDWTLARAWLQENLERVHFNERGGMGED